MSDAYNYQTFEEPAPEPLAPGADTTPLHADQHTSMAVRLRLKPWARFRSGEVVDAAAITMKSGYLQKTGAPNELRYLGALTEGALIAVLGPRGCTFVKSIDVANFTITNGNELRAAQDVDSGVYSVGIAAKNAQDEAGTVRTVTIYVEPHAPTDIELSAETVADNAAVDTKIADITATDEDEDDTFTFTCDDDHGLFKIGAGEAAGELQVAAALTAYNATTQTVTITATDASGLAFSKDFEISIT